MKIIFILLLIEIMLEDLYFFTIPDKMLLLCMPYALFRFVEAKNYVVFIIFLLVIIYRYLYRHLGFGDIKLLFILISSNLIENYLLFIFLATYLSLLHAIFIYIFKRKKEDVPLGTYLIFSFIICIYLK